MALTKEEILDAIASMTVLEVSELIKMMEEKFGVSAAAAAVAVAAPAAGAAAVSGHYLSGVPDPHRHGVAGQRGHGSTLPGANHHLRFPAGLCRR